MNIIDVVILWVDSSDSVWRNKVNQYLEKKINWKNKKESTRYNSINEVEITITSIIKNASYVRNIFLVTDNQEPNRFNELKELSKKSNIALNLIDHKVVFKGFESFLPVFNSLTIETMLFRIPNLSEHFIYFNDDFFLINKTKPEDFFINNNPVLRGKWLEFDENIWYLKALNSWKKKRVFSHRYIKEDTAKLLGFNKHFSVHHTPYPLRKSTIQEFFENNSDLLENNIKHRFRHKDQFLLQVLANHLEIKKGTCTLTNDLALTYTHKYSWFNIYKKVFKTGLKGNKVLFLCLQSLETINKRKLQFLLKWIDKKLDSNFANEL